MPKYTNRFLLCGKAVQQRPEPCNGLILCQKHCNRKGKGNKQADELYYKNAAGKIAAAEVLCTGMEYSTVSQK